jgi:hypothetical protein
VIDSFPVAVRDNYRIPHAKIYQDETLRGYLASKKRYFYEVKIDLMIAQEGQPIELFSRQGHMEMWRCYRILPLIFLQAPWCMLTKPTMTKDRRPLARGVTRCFVTDTQKELQEDPTLFCVFCTTLLSQKD